MIYHVIITSNTSITYLMQLKHDLLSQSSTIFINHIRSSCTWLYQIFGSSLFVPTKVSLLQEGKS